MKIQKQDIYHGPALMQIVEHPSFTALNKPDEKYGHYIVNTDRQLFVKYRDSDESPWRFTFQPEEIVAIKADIRRSNHETFICLVCGDFSICCLDSSELRSVIDLSSETTQWVSVEVPAGGSQHVAGSNGKLGYTIPHNSYPDKVLA
ncbi:MAG: hypothetical protein IH866_02020 [Chloroflexi bacterium]|nr:hypothetical protein [Chloroflexota bacterium]